MTNNDCFSLKEISEWQLNDSESNFILPPLQRGFVWKVNQIELLWDSLLRSFPIGSFLFSKNYKCKFNLLDGQQRATSIALGYYDPWHNNEDKKIGSLKRNPVVWIDLSPSEITETQQFVIRVVTKSHPWGYLRKKNDRAYPLSSSDKNYALDIFHEISNQKVNYTQLPLTKVFPYDANLPVPLCFVFKAVTECKQEWKKHLLALCKDKLPSKLRTKYFEDAETFFMKLEKTDFNSEHIKSIYDSVCKLNEVKIPGIFVPENVLFEEDGETTDPTLFIRFNRGGTRIQGEELIYSIYKAAFPGTKDLVENIQANYLAPSRVISLVLRLVQSKIENSFPYALNPVQFKKKIKEKDFKSKLQEFIGEKDNSPSKIIFTKAIELLRSESKFNLPSVLVKRIVNDNSDLFLILLKWLQINPIEMISENEKKKIIAVITTLSFFGSDNSRYVREIWNDLNKNFWNSQKLRKKFKDSNDFIMFPLQPKKLREFLLEQVVNNKKEWNSLYPLAENDILNDYKELIQGSDAQDERNAINGIWDFIKRLYSCRPLILIAQRKYINKNFGDFNQMETLEDTNVPWDWDHIYPDSWVYYQQTFQLIKDWNNCIGNFRALSFEKNRSEKNLRSPKDRLQDVKTREQSFIKDNDWKFWEKINNRIYQEDIVCFHSQAVINRMVNIYKEWYDTLSVEELLD